MRQNISVLLLAFVSCVCLIFGCTDGGLVATVSNSTGSDIRLVSVGTAEPEEKLPLVIPAGKSTSLHFSNFPDGFYFEVEYEGKVYEGYSGNLNGSIGHKGSVSIDIFVEDGKLSSQRGALKEVGKRDDQN